MFKVRLSLPIEAGMHVEESPVDADSFFSDERTVTFYKEGKPVVVVAMCNFISLEEVRSGKPAGT